MLTKVSQSTTLPFFPPKIKIETPESCCSAVVEDATLDHRADHHAFAVKTIAWAIQNQLSTKCIERYISKFAQSLVTYQIRLPVYAGFGVPTCSILFFAIEQNSPELIRLLCKAGHRSDRELPRQGCLLWHTLCCLRNTVCSTRLMCSSHFLPLVLIRKIYQRICGRLP